MSTQVESVQKESLGNVLDSSRVIGTERYSSAMAYRNHNVVGRLAQKCGMSLIEAEQCFEDTKQFLYLCDVLPGSYCPTKTIDEGWHAFILFTKDYALFCQNYLGRFIHHIPTTSVSEVDTGRPARTLKAAVLLFGIENLSPNWIFQSENGSEHVLMPQMVLGDDWDEVLDMIGPCGDSCGCNASCRGD